MAASISTQARGIHARGDIVGSYDDSEGLSHAFLLRNGVFSVVDVPALRSRSARGGSTRAATFGHQCIFGAGQRRVFVGQVQMRPDGAFLGFVRDAFGRFN